MLKICKHNWQSWLWQHPLKHFPFTVNVSPSGLKSQPWSLILYDVTPLKNRLMRNLLRKRRTERLPLKLSQLKLTTNASFASWCFPVRAAGTSTKRHIQANQGISASSAPKNSRQTATRNCMRRHTQEWGHLDAGTVTNHTTAKVPETSMKWSTLAGKNLAVGFVTRCFLER